MTKKYSTCTLTWMPSSVKWLAHYARCFDIIFFDCDARKLNGTHNTFHPSLQLLLTLWIVRPWSANQDQLSNKKVLLHCHLYFMKVSYLIIQDSTHWHKYRLCKVKSYKLSTRIFFLCFLWFLWKYLYRFWTLSLK